MRIHGRYPPVWRNAPGRKHASTTRGANNQVLYVCLPLIVLLTLCGSVAPVCMGFQVNMATPHVAKGYRRHLCK
jgi:hypothetical protein